MRCATSSRSRWSPARLAGRCERVLERPQHQGQRRAELVADVAEEGGLGAVELGQRLGALALLLRRRAALRHRGGDLAGDQVAEAAVASSNGRYGLRAGDQQPAASLALRSDRQRSAPASADAPTRRSEGRRSARRGHRPRSRQATPRSLGERPAFARVAPDRRSPGCGCAARDAGGAGQLEPAPRRVSR